MCGCFPNEFMMCCPINQERTVLRVLIILIFGNLFSCLFGLELFLQRVNVRCHFLFVASVMSLIMSCLQLPPRPRPRFPSPHPQYPIGYSCAGRKIGVCGCVFVCLKLSHSLRSLSYIVWISAGNPVTLIARATSRNFGWLSRTFKM